MNTCFLINKNPINILNGWNGVKFRTIKDVITISQVDYTALDPRDKVVMKWIWTQVNNCPNLKQYMSIPLAPMLAWP